MSYLQFQEAGTSPSGITKKWSVMNGAMSLGVISWYSAWRRYTFSPVAGTTFDQACLAEICDFLRKETQCHIASRA